MKHLCQYPGIFGLVKVYRMMIYIYVKTSEKLALKIVPFGIWITNPLNVFCYREKISKYKYCFIPPQVTPSPSNPALHAHVKAPAVLVHVASAWQLSVFATHSSISER